MWLVIINVGNSGTSAFSVGVVCWDIRLDNWFKA